LILIKLKPCKTFTQTIFPSLWSHQNNRILSHSATVFLAITLFPPLFLFKPMVPSWLIAPCSTPPSFHCSPFYPPTLHSSLWWLYFTIQYWISHNKTN
jgi:hypothetical protein